MDTDGSAQARAGVQARVLGLDVLELDTFCSRLNQLAFCSSSTVSLQSLSRASARVIKVRKEIHLKPCVQRSRHMHVGEHYAIMPMQ